MNPYSFRRTTVSGVTPPKRLALLMALAIVLLIILLEVGLLNRISFGSKSCDSEKAEKRTSVPRESRGEQGRHVSCHPRGSAQIGIFHITKLTSFSQTVFDGQSLFCVCAAPTLLS